MLGEGRDVASRRPVCSIFRSRRRRRREHAGAEYVRQRTKEGGVTRVGRGCCVLTVGFVELVARGPRQVAIVLGIVSPGLGKRKVELVVAVSTSKALRGSLRVEERPLWRTMGNVGGGRGSWLRKMDDLR